MTQGEDYHHGSSSGEYRRTIELSRRSETVSSSTRDIGTSDTHAVTEALLSPCPPPPPPVHSHSRSGNRQQQTVAHGGEDAKNLLQFVHHASCDIKAALDQGNYARSKHWRQQQQQQQHFRQSSPPSPGHSHHDNEHVNNDIVVERVRKNPSPMRRSSLDSMLPHHVRQPSHHATHQPPSRHPHHHLHHPHFLGHDRHRSPDNEPRTEKHDTSRDSPRDLFGERRLDLPYPFGGEKIEHKINIEKNSNAIDFTCKLRDGEVDGDSEKRTDMHTQMGNESSNTRHNESDNLDLFSCVNLLSGNCRRKSKGDDESNGASDGDSNNESEESATRGGHVDEKKTMPVIGGYRESSKINGVPLRKRRLPASFWQEPKGKSENHRILNRPAEHSHDGQPRSFVHHPGLSLFGQLKLPLPTPMSPSHLDFDFGIGRHFCGSGEKNPFAFPSTSSSAAAAAAASSPFLNLNLNLGASYPRPPHLPHLSLPHGGMEGGDRHRHGGGLSMPCGNNFCMCHLQNLAACSSGVQEPPSPSASGLFARSPVGIAPISPLDTNTSSALALNRWSAAMQSMEATPDLLGGYPMARVLKPIPTKSLSSYPPRFHPIFT